MTALELADYLDGLYCSADFNLDKGFAAAAELRRLAELERDAFRYRWLRDRHWVEQEATFRLGLSDTEFLDQYHKELDAAIDAAMGESK